MGFSFSDLDPTNIVKDAVDFVGDFIDNPLDALGGLAEDITKGTLGIVTLGLSNRYDLGYWRDKFKPDMPEQVFDDRRVSARDSLAPREIVYGKVRKGGTIVYIETEGEFDEYLHLLIVVADHAVSKIDRVYAGEQWVKSHTSTSGGVGYYSTVSSQSDDFDMGTSLEVLSVTEGGLTMPSAIYNASESAPPSLNANTALTGCAYVWLRLKYDREAFPRGIPNFSFDVIGKSDIYDPRTTTSGYTTNAALCILDFLRHDNGLAIPDADIDMPSFEAAANYDAQTVDGQTRFTCNGVISLEGSALQALEELVKTSGSIVTNAGGKWRIIPAEYQAPSLTLTQSDLIGDFEFSPRAPKGSRFNGAKGVYKSTTGKNIEYRFPTIDAYIAADGEELVTESNFSFVNNANQASRLAKIQIERSRYGALFEGRFNFKAADLEVGDRVTLDINDFSLNGVFLVLNVSLSLEGGVALTLAQDSADVYSWTDGDGFVETAPPVLSLPSPRPIAPTGLAYTEELYSVNNGRDFKSRALITWQGATDRDQDYDVRIKVVGGAFAIAYSDIPTTDASIYDLGAGDYVVEVRSRNSLGRSVWVSLSVTILGKLAPPPKVDAVLLTGNKLSWSYPSQPSDHAGFLVRYHAGNRQTWSDATRLHSGIITASPFDVSGLIEGEATFLVKAIDSTGNESNEAAFVLANIGGATAQNAVLEHKVSEEVVDVFASLSVPVGGDISPSPTIGHYWTIEQSAYNEVKNIWGFPANTGGGFGNRVTSATKQLDGTKRHRFSIAVKFSDLLSSNSLRFVEASTVTLKDHATGANLGSGFKNFLVQSIANLPELLPNTWLLFVGEIFEHTASNDATSYGGVFDMSTGQKVRDVDLTLRFATSSQFLSFSFGAVAGAATGEILVDDFRLEVVDGTEPTVAELCASRQPQTTNLVDGDVMTTPANAPDYFVGFTKSANCEQVNTNQIQALALSGKYGASNAPFYDPQSSDPFYQTTYSAFTLETIFNRRLALDFDEADLGYPFKFYFEINNPAVSATLEYALASWPLVDGERDWQPTDGNIGALEDETYLFRISVPQHFGTIRPTITDIGYYVDLPDVIEIIEDLVIPSTETTLPISKAYRKITHITLTLQDDGSGANSARVTSKDKAAPKVRAYNAAGSPVGTTLDILVRGY